MLGQYIHLHSINPSNTLPSVPLSYEKYSGPFEPAISGNLTSYLYPVLFPGNKTRKTLQTCSDIACSMQAKLAWIEIQCAFACSPSCYQSGHNNKL